MPAKISIQTKKKKVQFHYAQLFLLAFSVDTILVIEDYHGNKRLVRPKSIIQEVDSFA